MTTDWQTVYDLNNFLVDLSDIGLLKVTGDDAVNFLQGQVTNDVTAINASHSHYSGYCSPKGRLLALFFVFEHQDQLYLSFDADLVASIQKRLQMYVMRAKVNLTDERENLARFGVAGDTAEAQLASLYPSIPTKPHEVVQHEDISIIRMPMAKPAFQIIAHRDQHSALYAKLSSAFTNTEKDAWNHLETTSGIPEIVSATQEAFVPQMVNLDALDGINFKKGCYTGQEIVARTHYLGKVKRGTRLGTLQLPAGSKAKPAAGDIITDATQQNVGQVVRASTYSEDMITVLFECRIDSLSSGLRWQNTPIALQDLPYSVTEPEA